MQFGEVPTGLLSTRGDRIGTDCIFAVAISLKLAGRRKHGHHAPTHSRQTETRTTLLNRMDVQILKLAARPTAYVPFSHFDRDMEPIWRWLPYGNKLLCYRMKWLLRNGLLSTDHASKRRGVRSLTILPMFCPRVIRLGH
jgi:hypothetical protein